MNLEFTNTVPTNPGVYMTRFERMGKVYIYVIEIVITHNVIEWRVYNAGDAMLKPISRLANAEFAIINSEFLIAKTLNTDKE